MGGITGSFAITAGTGLSGNGTPASPLSNTGVTSFIGQTGAVDATIYNGIGSYVIAFLNFPTSPNSAYGPNITCAGSELFRMVDSNQSSGLNGAAATTITAGTSTSCSLSGTWRMMTRSYNIDYAANFAKMPNLFVRIA